MAIIREGIATGAGSHIVIHTESRFIEEAARRSYETSKMPTHVFSPTWFLKISITSVNGATFRGQSSQTHVPVENISHSNPHKKEKIILSYDFRFPLTVGSIALDCSKEKHCGSRSMWHRRLLTWGPTRDTARMRKGPETSCILEKHPSCDPHPLTNSHLLVISFPVNMSGDCEVGSHDPIISQHYLLGENPSIYDLVGIPHIQTIKSWVWSTTAPSEHRRLC